MMGRRNMSTLTSWYLQLLSDAEKKIDRLYAACPAMVYTRL